MVGYAFGGLRGAYHGLKRTYNSPSLNIRANALMNGIMRQGTPLSTTLATIGMYVCIYKYVCMYAYFRSFLRLYVVPHIK